MRPTARLRHATMALALATAPGPAAAEIPSVLFVDCTDRAAPVGALCTALAATLAERAPGFAVWTRAPRQGERGWQVGFRAETATEDRIRGRLLVRPAGAAPETAGEAPTLALEVTDGALNDRLVARFAETLLDETPGPWRQPGAE